MSDLRKRILKGAVAVLAGALLFFNIPEAKTRVHAVTISMNGDDNGMIKNKDREGAYVILLEDLKALKKKQLSASQIKQLDDIMYDANVYIANTEMTVEQLESYISTVQSRFSAVASGNVPDASKFLFVANNTMTTSAKYSQPVTVTLSVVNLGQAPVTDVVITPSVDTSMSKWPFEILTASDARMIDSLQPAKSIEQSVGLAKQVTWNFMVSSEAKTGVYPLTFHAQYYRGSAVEECDLKTYIKITGKSSSGKLLEEEQKADDAAKSATPRIIIKGFKTYPEEVYAGDTFRLTITVENTSTSTAVSNIQFDLKAAQEGEKQENSYEAFLPTSGSNTIYVSRIDAGETADLEIEMFARADLTQKPYVIDLNMEYEDTKHNPYKASNSVSIPVRQAARVDTGDLEITPSEANVGDQVNVMFPIYNKGKTTLYNVSVSFDAASLDGGNAFLGQVEPGATGNVDVMLNAVAATEDDGTVVAHISYEDEAGKVTLIEKPMNIFVTDASFSEGMGGEIDENGDGIMDGFDYDGDGVIDEYYEQQGSKAPGWLIILIAVLVTAAVMVVIIIIVKKNKKKKMEAALAELADDEDGI